MGTSTFTFPTILQESFQGVTVWAERIMAWYERVKRDLPWRNTQDPYHIWLSEIILQQTRVAQGLPYYERFLAAYPTLQDLAAAPEQEVFKLWEGLGYYRRARNLHACARYLVDVYDGNFPADEKWLLKLPGVGPYTAAAIASFAFNLPVATVDGNVYRVLSRVAGIEADITHGKNQKAFALLAQKLLPEAYAAHYNQAMMEFGAIHCTPKQPLCHACPFADACVAKKQQKQHILPVKKKKKRLRQRFFYYFILRDGRHIYMKKRGKNDIWSGLYDFFLVEQENPIVHRSDLKKLLSPIAKQNEMREFSIDYVHLLTHQKIHASFVLVDCESPSSDILENQELVGFLPQEIHLLPVPVLINKLYADYPSWLVF